MSQIKKISFRNYKAFGGELTEIDIKPITLFIGKNSSGKSSILKLISVLGSLTSEYAIGPMILGNKDVSLGGRYEDIFHNNQMTDFSIGVEFENGIKVNVSYYIDKGNLYVYRYSIENEEKNKIETLGTPDKVFNGLVHEESLKSLNISKVGLAFNTAYISPLRVQPERNIQLSSDQAVVNVCYNGSNTYSLLLKSYLSDKKTLFNNVSSWLEKNLEGQAINFERNSPTSGTYSLYIKHGDAKVNIADVGQGLPQVLPIITQSFVENKVDIILVEQPVLHLHPAAHAAVAYRLAGMVKKYNRKCVIETHSENVLLAIRNLVADSESDLKPEDVVIYFVDTDDDNEAYLQTITIDEDGQLSTWPEGIFSESFDLLAQIMQHRKK